MIFFENLVLMSFLFAARVFFNLEVRLYPRVPSSQSLFFSSDSLELAPPPFGASSFISVWLVVEHAASISKWRIFLMLSFGRGANRGFYVVLWYWSWTRCGVAVAVPGLDVGGRGTTLALVVVA